MRKNCYLQDDIFFSRLYKIFLLRISHIRIFLFFSENDIFDDMFRHDTNSFIIIIYNKSIPRKCSSQGISSRQKVLTTGDHCGLKLNCGNSIVTRILNAYISATSSCYVPLIIILTN